MADPSGVVLDAVMSHGLVEQLGTPRAVYEEPASVFVADFLGVSNLMRARGDGGGRVCVADATLVAGEGAVGATGDVRLTIRPERIEIEPHGAPGDNRLAALLERLVYLGSTTQLILRLAGGDTLQALVANAGAPLGYGQGDAVMVHLPADALRVLAEEAAGPDGRPDDPAAPASAASRNV